MSLRKKMAESIHGSSDVQIGKQGLTESLLEELRSRLEKKEVVKVRVLKSALATTGLTRREIAEKVSEALGARLVDVRGRTFILYKPRPEKAPRG